MHHLVYYLIVISEKFKLNQAGQYIACVCLGVGYFILPHLHFGFQVAQKRYNAIQKESWSAQKLLYER